MAVVGDLLRSWIERYSKKDTQNHDPYSLDGYYTNYNESKWLHRVEAECKLEMGYYCCSVGVDLSEANKKMTVCDDHENEPYVPERYIAAHGLSVELLEYLSGGRLSYAYVSAIDESGGAN